MTARRPEDYQHGDQVVLPKAVVAILGAIMPREVLSKYRHRPDVYPALVAVRCVALDMGKLGGSAVTGTGSAARPQPAAESKDGLLGVDAARRLIGISPEAVRKACRQKRLPGQQIDGRWLIRKADAEAYRDNMTSRAA